MTPTPTPLAAAVPTREEALAALQQYCRGMTFYDGHPLQPVFAFLESGALIGGAEEKVLHEGWALLECWENDPDDDPDDEGAVRRIRPEGAKGYAERNCRPHMGDRVARVRIVEVPPTAQPPKP